MFGFTPYLVRILITMTPPDNQAAVPSDVAIAQAHQLTPIEEIAKRAGIAANALLPYGRTKAKIDVSAADWSGAASNQKTATDGKLVLVTGMSPTPAGEGKSTILIGLTDAIAKTRNAMVAIREPSLGPVFGIKGGAAGGGYAQIVPMEDINLHFTGDLHAITAANNTLAAMIDNHIHHGNELNIDPRRVTWRRCLDVNDRSLRHIITGLGGPSQGTPREAGFDITAASEIMAILCLANDLEDLTHRLGNIVIGQTFTGQPVHARQLQAEGALTALLKEAINPNLVQTLGGTPALVHGGPFANIAHGCNSLIATRTALRLADVVLTEAGFGSDLGAEKFFDVKARYGNLRASAVVIVATVRSLKYNGGMAREELQQENLPALRDGLANLQRHVENVRKFHVEPIVALNQFTTDTEAELELIEDWADKFGVRCARADVWAHGGDGATALAQEVLEVLDDDTIHDEPQQLYPTGTDIEQAIHTIAAEIYHASNVSFSKSAQKDLAFIRDNGWGELPVVISKTQYSFSDDPTQLGAPSGHTLHVRQLIPKIGAGFIVALTGEVMTLPGLPKRPAAENISVDSNGTTQGLF